MKVLLINGSSKNNGCTFTALNEVAKTLEEQGIDTEFMNLGSASVRDCIGCKKCVDLDKKCIFDDDIVNDLINAAAEADGFIFGTPVYYAHPSGRILSVLDRAFYAGSSVFRHKPGAAIASARRSGTTASIDVLNKYFTFAEMPIVSSTYWNTIHGNSPDETIQDLEGIQIMRNLGLNMAWLLKCIEIGKENGIEIPLTDRSQRTNFIR